MKNKLMQWVVNLIRLDMNFFMEEMDETPEYCIGTYKEILYREREKDGLQRSNRKSPKR